MLPRVAGTWLFKVSSASLLAALMGWGMIEIFHIHRNQQLACEALKVIAQAESLVKSDDRDGNGMADYWIGDVAGLRRGVSSGPPINLVSAEIAAADAAPLQAQRPQPFAGYTFIALRRDAAGTAYDDGNNRSWSKFGFAAVPANYPWDGVHTFFVNESNVIVSRNTRGKAPEAYPSDAR